MEREIEEQRKKTYRYFYDDGLVELAIGLLFVATGMMLFAWFLFEDSPMLTVVVVLGTIVLVTGGTFLIKRFVSEMKERVTYPRTGYVGYRQGEPAKGRWLIPLAALAVVALSFLIPEALNNMALMVGALMATVMVLMGYRVGVWRFYLVGLIALISGLGLTLLEVAEIIAVSLTFSITGLTLIILGTVTLTYYLQKHPKPIEQ